MALNIKNPEVERLAAEIADLTGESKTETIRRALLDRQAHLQLRVTKPARRERLRRFLEEEVWSRVPEDQRGMPPSKEEREAILDYGEGGV